MRGDHARKGLGGLLAKERYVHVKYSKPGPKVKYITAFGLCDDEDKNTEGEGIASRIFASTAGADWKDADDFREFWNGAKYVTIGKNPFYQGGGVMPHSFYPVFTTRELPFTDFNKMQISLPKW